MAIYRSIHITFWQDSFVLNLTPEEKYFYLYLMTNSKTKQSGAYELPIKIITLETGYNDETVRKLIMRFENMQKISYDEKTQEIILINWLKFNPVTNNNIFICVKKELADIKSEKIKTQLNYIFESFQGKWTNRDFADLLLSEIEIKENIQDAKEEKEKIPFDTLWTLYDKKTGSKPKLSKKWNKLSEATQLRVLEHVKEYKEATPDKQFRKNLETYLNNQSWNDEIIRGHNEIRTANKRSIDEIWRHSDTESAKELGFDVS